jgi:ribonuclease P/MRP protein subunit POP5
MHLLIRTLKKRYIGFRVASDRVHSRREVSTLIYDELRATKSGHEKMMRVRLLDYDVEKGVGMLLCDHKSVEKVRGAFNNIQSKSRGKMTIQMIGVSGTIKALKRKFLSKIS